MPDLSKLKGAKTKAKVIDPEEIFRRLPKPPGINDLYQSQAEVLRGWFARRAEHDLVIKLHTGGGKTLVGLLMAQSAMNETGEPVMYLTPTVQLMNQVIAKAREYSIHAVPYAKGREPLPDAFINGQAVLVGTYSALFNGVSKFGVAGTGDVPVSAGMIILDDAHASLSVVRDQFTLSVKADGGERKVEELKELYNELCSMFRAAFQQVERLGTFDDVVSGAETAVLEVPYWAWSEKRDAVRERLRAKAEHFKYVWPLLRDRLDLCHAFISSNAFTLTPWMPLVDALPTFVHAPRRVYMSATIADDSAIVRTFDVSAEAVAKPLQSKSLAGVSERMVLVPEAMPFKFDVTAYVKKVATKIAALKKGVVILVPSVKAGEAWKDIAELPETTKAAEEAIEKLQSGASFGPLALASRYDGIDLPGNACRVLLMSGLPKGSSDYELFRGVALLGGRSINSATAQRVEQGIGRGARGAGDYCVVLLLGQDLVGWLSKEANFRFLTASTRAQIEMGQEISKATADDKDFGHTIMRSLERDKEWMEYHADQLADALDHESVATERIREASVERKAMTLFADGHPEKAIKRITEYLDGSNNLDPQTTGWFEQMAARFAHAWGNEDLARELQASAYAKNRVLHRPLIAPPYQPIKAPAEQSRSIAENLAGYRIRRGFLQDFEETVALLVASSSANQFEQALADFGRMIGFSTQRPESTGEPGSDVLWLLPERIGLIIEAKSRKKKTSTFSKDNHGQLLVSQVWFTAAYPNYTAVRVSVHPSAVATTDSVPIGVKALTYEKLQEMIGDARSFFARVCESNVPPAELPSVVDRALKSSNLSAERILMAYLQEFRVS